LVQNSKLIDVEVFLIVAPGGSSQFVTKDKRLFWCSIEFPLTWVYGVVKRTSVYQSASNTASVHSIECLNQVISPLQLLYKYRPLLQEAHILPPVGYFSSSANTFFPPSLFGLSSIDLLYIWIASSLRPIVNSASP
jgi:hypothetical protein